MEDKYKQEALQLMEVLGAVRKHKKLKQKDFAVMSGFTQQVISDMETGKRVPSLSNFIKYIEALGVVMSFDFGLEEGK